MVIVAPSSVTPEIVPVCVCGGGGECVDCPQSAAGTEHNESTAASVEALKLYANLNLLLLALVACIVQKKENDRP